MTREEARNESFWSRYLEISERLVQALSCANDQLDLDEIETGLVQREALIESVGPLGAVEAGVQGLSAQQVQRLQQLDQIISARLQAHLHQSQDRIQNLQGQKRVAQAYQDHDASNSYFIDRKK